ncbi:Aromatic ring-opening dioxygenase, catalytic subunit, LigB family [Paenibacillus sp. UNCCL117]|uniref:dioxygenase family protein n=1 Tax=unclassified Paenibacillus TaxID=185978 RepID=UPI00087ED20E|nr:Aromatic ring-opening dioxygenase, catalytic subunit, LigB family [Paenibacillus sp. cl123]SFW58970.1 Aromatic ring-opening dioxygenase, catalytic subunit, LigB family [Paenibacillus sp. UNCCL117]
MAHGLPTLASEPHRYGRFLSLLASKLPKPRAIVIFSSHWEAAPQRIGSAVRYETIHDFFGYPEELYAIQYRAQGEIALALQIRLQLEKEGISCELDDQRGLDHGAWIVLKLMYPLADVPVVSMSVNPALVPEEHYRIGRALSLLRERQILILGSGGTVHNLGKLSWQESAADDWAIAFDEWLAECLETWDIRRLFRYDLEAPYAGDAVAGAGHLAPLLIAMGSAHSGKKAKLLHRQYQYGSLSLSCWMFG